MKIKTGQIQISLAMAMAAVSFIAAPLIGYFSSQMAIGNRISGVDTEIQVTKSRVDGIEKKLDKMDEKLDALLLKNNIKIK